MTTVSELAEVSAAIHDEYFNLEHLRHLVDSAELHLSIYAGRRRKHWLIETSRRPDEPLPPPMGTLVVRNVIDVSVEDEAGIGWFDINRLDWDVVSGELRIVSNVPCEIVARCRGLDVEFVWLSGDRAFSIT